MKEKPYLESGKKFRTWHQKVTSNIFLLQVYSPCNVVSFCFFATILRNKKTISYKHFKLLVQVKGFSNW